jgi:hypothetical protein
MNTTVTPILSVRQPWAWMIIHGGKDIENRRWHTKVRGPVLIHASGGCTRQEYYEASGFAFLAIGGGIWDNYPEFEDLQRGGIVGQVEVVDCVSESDSPWFVGPYGFVLRNPVALPWRPMRGKLGFFEAS